MRHFLRYPFFLGGWFLQGGLIFAAFCVLALSLFLGNDYQREKASTEGLWRYRLWQLSSNRAELVARWAAARGSDAIDLASYPAVSETLSTGGGREGRRLLERRLSLLARGYGYHAICIDGEPSSQGPLCSGGATSLRTALGASQLEQLKPGSSTMFPMDDSAGRRFICVAARSRAPGPPAGAFLFVDPAQWLHPALKAELSFGPPVTFLLASSGKAGLIAGSSGSVSVPPEWADSLFAPVSSGGKLEGLPPLETWRSGFFAVRQAIPGTDWVFVSLVSRSLALREMERQLFTRAAAVGALGLALIALVFGLERESEVRHLRALSQQEERHRLLSDNAADMVLYVGEDGTIFDVNRAAESACGLARHELLDRPLAEVFTPAGGSDPSSFMEKGFSAGALVEGFWRRARGAPIEVEVSCRGVQVDGQRIALLIARDVSRRKEAEAALLAAKQALEQAKQLEAVGLVASGVAHEVRNPLFAISSIVTALERKLKDRPEFDQYVGHILEQVGRLSTLMNDLLALGRPVDSSSYAKLDLAQTVRVTIRHLAQSLQEADERCKLDLPEYPVLVWGSAEKLEQVVLNLLQNALAFSPPEESVEVHLLAESGEAVLEVLDRGPGIPDEIHEHLFEPFQSHRKGGTGLGLAIVRKIVSAHGGIVLGENRTPLPGARFTVRVPLSG